MLYAISGGAFAGASMGGRSGGQIIHMGFSDFITCIIIIVVGVIIICKLITEMK